jgi:hypothetical protein
MQSAETPVQSSPRRFDLEDFRFEAAHAHHITYLPPNQRARQGRDTGKGPLAGFGLIFADDAVALLAPIIACNRHLAAEADHGGITRSSYIAPDLAIPSVLQRSNSDDPPSKSGRLGQAPARRIFSRAFWRGSLVGAR